MSSEESEKPQYEGLDAWENDPDSLPGHGMAIHVDKVAKDDDLTVLLTVELDLNQILEELKKQASTIKALAGSACGDPLVYEANELLGLAKLYDEKLFREANLEQKQLMVKGLEALAISKIRSLPIQLLADLIAVQLFGAVDSEVFNAIAKEDEQEQRKILARIYFLAGRGYSEVRSETIAQLHEQLHKPPVRD